MGRSTAVWALLLATFPAHAVESIVIDAFAVVPGDRWEFEGQRNGGPSMLTIEILERGHDGRIKVKTSRSGQDAIEYRDDAMNILVGGRPDRPQVAVRLPLAIGGGWTFDNPTDSSSTSYAGEGRVVGQRTLTVPAGTFECLEVEAAARYSVGRGYNNEYRSTRWYCPAIKWFAQEHYRGTTTSAYNPADNVTNEGSNRLVKFTSGSP